MRYELKQRASAALDIVRAGSRRLVYRAAAAAMLAVMLLVAGVLWGYWSNLYKDAQARSATLALLLAEQTTRTFQAVDLTLAGLEPVLSTVPPLPDHAPAVEKLLAQRVAELDFVRAISVVDAAGRVTQTSGALTGIVADGAAQPYLDQFRRDPDLKFLVGQPLFSSPGRLSAIPVMRRLSTPAGDLDGMVVASVEPQYFSDFYRNLDLGRRGSIDLYQDNGSILLASTSEAPAPDAPLPLAAAPSFDLASTLGNFRSPGAVSDQRLIAFHRAGSYPLVVAVGIDLADLRARWWRIAWPSIAATVAIAALGWSLAVTAVRRLDERRRARSRAVMVQKLEALGQMTASVSHDFRNLLAVMTSTLRLVRRRGPDETVLRAAEEALERGDKLIGQLLAFSKNSELQARPVSINALLDALDGMLRHAAGAGIALSYDKGEDLPLCQADATQFDAALMNLVVNARQAMPGGGRVTIVTRSAGARGVELSVADTGTGIAPGDLKRVFEPFFTTKAEGGTGLGLAQVFGFMRRIGGDATVTSQVGVGTTFTLLFPLAAEQRKEAARPAA
ncbi:hybrid sensor histidine kinase/response regulator [Lichenibacterium dinghuense]|uniref:hybrid sensor histidine kinase/response regulator n=1 Tax=Lichenibacterium dinghuense TaxID=2895977 RepID=UPI001F1FF41B|nr:hybrid sensor histidine kinase/response regulator [Lichenibacterium sp. 6Y81]